MVGEAPNLDSCAVCGRTILRGEQVSEYVTTDRQRAGVCSLCKDRAEAAGWVPAALAGRAGEGQQPRRRRSEQLRETLGRYGERLRERAASVPVGRPERREPAAKRPAEPQQRPSPRPPTPERPLRPPPPPRPPTPEGMMRLAIDAFNASPERRKIAGLIRSLGEPRVSVRTPTVVRGPAMITVAWELSWYQWEVGADADGGRVREVAKGSEISELPETQRRWNAAASRDGALALHSPAGPSASGA